METKPIYLTDSYKKTCKAKIISIKKEGDQTSVILDQTIFYPFGGGQPADQGTIEGKKGTLNVQQVNLKGDDLKHVGKLEGSLSVGDTVICTVDWNRRFFNMRNHSAGHIIHEAVKSIFPDLVPVEGEHGKKSYIKYKGLLEEVSANLILTKANEIIKDSLPILTEFVTLEELKKRSPWVPEHLPTNKPLRIMWIGNFPPIPDGGTQVSNTSEVENIDSIQIVSDEEFSFVHYKTSNDQEIPEVSKSTTTDNYNLEHRERLINLKNQTIAQISEVRALSELEQIRIDLFGKNGKFTIASKDIKNIPVEERRQYGVTLNEVKNTLEELMSTQKNDLNNLARVWFDPTIPSKKTELGHLHMVTRAIDEIATTFEKIGFIRSRYPEADWDYFAFEALNMPTNHAARDEWETFFIDEKPNNKMGQIVLTPHTSNGQVREMLRVGKPPIRMINIAKCYRRQSDVSHYPMFHQFEGLVIDENISIVNLKGTLDYFAKSFFGETRKTRLRPYHFQFTEPSFEVDISCNVCDGKGCKLCKEGWLELGGAGMVHPNVLKSGNIDTKKYTGFAFGWGVERTYMMKSGLAVPDIRLLYSSDLRVLKQL